MANSPQGPQPSPQGSPSEVLGGGSMKTSGAQAPGTGIPEIGGEDEAEARPQRDDILGKDPVSGREKVRGRVAPWEAPPKAADVTAPDIRNIEEMVRQIANTTEFQPYELPSRGRLYPQTSPFHNGHIMIRAMRTSEEQLLFTPRLYKTGDLVELLFKGCVMFENNMAIENALELLSVDRMFVLIAIRLLSYGPEYECGINCGSCGHSFDALINLNDDLDIHHLEDLAITEPFQSVFPVCGLPFTYRLMRGEDEQTIHKHQRKRSAQGGARGADDSLLVKASLLIQSIGEINGEPITDKQAIMKALRNLNAQDSHHMRKCFDNPPFGVDTRIMVACPSCQRENRMRLPMGADFFLPPTTRNSNGLS